MCQLLEHYQWILQKPGFTWHVVFQHYQLSLCPVTVLKYGTCTSLNTLTLFQVDDNKKLGEWVGLCKIDREGKPRKVVGCSCVVVKVNRCYVTGFSMSTIFVGRGCQSLPVMVLMDYLNKWHLLGQTSYASQVQVLCFVPCSCCFFHIWLNDCQGTSPVIYLCCLGSLRMAT